MEELLIPRYDAAKAMGISVDTLDRLERDGQLHPVRIGVKVLYDPNELRAFVKRLKEGRYV